MARLHIENDKGGIDDESWTRHRLKECELVINNNISDETEIKERAWLRPVHEAWIVGDVVRGRLALLDPALMTTQADKLVYHRGSRDRGSSRE